MKQFKYRAMDSNGKKVEANFEANSEAEVMEMLSRNGYYPLMLKEVIKSSNVEFSFGQKVTTKDISIFCRQFYTMLDAGVTINNALNILSNQITNVKLRDAIRDVEEQVEKGESLSKAMAEQGTIFPSLLITMVESGEVSGNLDRVMLRMSNHYEKENKINNKIKGAMTYPMILGVVAVGVVIFLITYIMPTFMDMFEESGTVLPITTKMLVAMSEFMISNWVILLIIITAIVLVIKYYAKTEHGKYTVSKLKLTLPILKTLNEKIIVSRFSRTLSTLLASGVSIGQSLQIISTVVGNKVAEDALNKVRERVFRGEGLSEPMKESGVFPLMLSSMIKIGEETGTMDEILEKTADFYDEEVEQAITTATTMIEPLMIIVMGIVVGFIIISIMMPLFSMYGDI